MYYNYNIYILHCMHTHVDNYTQEPSPIRYTHFNLIPAANLQDCIMLALGE